VQYSDVSASDGEQKQAVKQNASEELVLYRLICKITCICTMCAQLSSENANGECTIMAVKDGPVHERKVPSFAISLTQLSAPPA
jgi:hypothetical protein